VAVSRCLFNLRTGKRVLKKTSGFYTVKETGVCMPRTAWQYGNARVLSPVAVFRGSSVFASLPGISKLFRTDFQEGEPFDTDFVRVSEEDMKRGLSCAAAKLYKKGAKWESPSADSRRHLNRAMLASRNHLVVATPDGRLRVHHADTGELLHEQPLGTCVWDGLAAAGGRLFASTQCGKVLCLGSSEGSEKVQQ